ncbi:hypothetical protein HK105_201518 [Polyrhizophydium stewartii]|uniref:FAD/NAD(P)-binding domain-containing protein n=1 Tax=Polyrhizophydium stewartii TaxID=2732419 RepID=A0ABR4NGL8_9FUNG
MHAAIAPAARRSLATVSAAAPRQQYRVVVVGGGAAGVTVAAQLGKHAAFFNKKDVLIIEPSETHYYQPLWTLVGGGLKSLSSTARPMASVIPSHADWLKARVSKIEPTANVVRTDDGKEIAYDFLVVAPGISINIDKIEGLKESLGKDGVSTNYLAAHVEKTFEFIKAFQGGNAIFTQPSTPIKCAGAPQKIMYLAEEHFRDKGLRGQTNVSFYSGIGKIFGVDKYANSLTEVCKKRDINVNLLHDLVAVRPDKKQAVFKKVGGDGGPGEVVVAYDFLHVTPPMGPLPFIRESGLADEAGWVSVDRATTQHVAFKNVFSLGDSSSLPTSRTAAAVAAQSGVTTANLLSAIEGRPLAAAYDGYTSCPLVTGRDKLILAEFNGYTLQPRETFHFDQSVERPSMYRLKADMLDKIYWELMLKGNWVGPAPFRPLLNPLDRN